MSECPSSDKLLSTGPVVGLAIAGTFLFEGLVGAFVWLAIVLRRSKRAKKKRESTRPLAAETEEGETSAVYTHRSSFVEKWLGKEAVTTYTPVEIEETVERTPHASYTPGDMSLVSAFPPPPTRQPSQRLPLTSPTRLSQDQHGGDVSFYSTAIAASLVIPSQVSTPYDPPTPSVPPALVGSNRPELPRLNIPSPPLPQPHKRAPPSITSQTSYLRKLSRSLITPTFDPAPSLLPPSSHLPLPIKPNPPTPPPFVNNLNPPYDPITFSSLRNDSLNDGSNKERVGRSCSQRSHLPVQSSGLIRELSRCCHGFESADSACFDLL